MIACYNNEELRMCYHLQVYWLYYIEKKYKSDKKSIFLMGGAYLNEP